MNMLGQFLIFIIIIIYLSYWVSYLIHEIGHLIVAKLIGWNVIFMQCGYYGLYKRVNGWAIERRNYQQYNTLIIFPIDIMHSELLKKYLLILYSGYISNIIFITLLINFYLKAEGILKYYIFISMIISSIVLMHTLKYNYNIEGISDSLLIKLLKSKNTRFYLLEILLYEMKYLNAYIFMKI
ncbi:hypothetical protein BBG10_08795 [Streptococcus dysgalactiae subsp. equisimilis]|uniref:hypothetical protein n=1 Tax=Streptococcus dysgalactiae TaxID=1334 RepID=UPI000824D9AF|nr:hypothetical protein [Streptococcus dysgalactiae]OCX00569.1 hypothetical protein BBG10_08795 [Streptococcus dysgalactiae subsp. equisimilis]